MDVGNNEGQAPSVEQQREAIHLASIEDEAFSMLGAYDGGIEIGVDPVTNTSVVKGHSIDTSMASKAPGPGRIWFGNSLHEGLSDALGLNTPFLLEVKSRTGIRAGGGKHNMPDQELGIARFFFDNRGNFAKVAVVTDDMETDAEVFYENEDDKYVKLPFTPEDFELAGIALTIVRDRLRSYKDKGLI